jgi:hydrogenase maturation protease
VLVVGVGNADRGDDAAGLIVARIARERLARSAAVAHCECGGDITVLLDRWRGVDTALIVDAVHSGAAPGRVHRFDASRRALPAPLQRRSTHVFGVAQVVELGRALGCLPRRVIVYGIEAGSVAHAEPPSQAVVSAAAVVAQRIVRAARRAAARVPVRPATS